jgi:hypothetical protein
MESSPAGTAENTFFTMPFLSPLLGLFHIGWQPAVETAGYFLAPLRGCYCANANCNCPDSGLAALVPPK